MNELGLNLGFLLVQILNLVLVAILPLALALLVYRWMTGVSRELEAIRRELGEVNERLDAWLDYLNRRQGA